MTVGMFFALIGVIAILLGLQAIALGAPLHKTLALFFIGACWLLWGFGRDLGWLS